MAEAKKFIIIDDDEFNNKICTVTLEKISPNADIKSFLDPVKGFEYVTKEFPATSAGNAILFLDINMPVMNGWEFLERFEEADQSIKDRIKIYILSSSVDKRDIERAKKNKNVIHYLVKPLTRETISLVIHGNQ